MRVGHERRADEINGKNVEAVLKEGGEFREAVPLKNRRVSL